jgi:glycosyltransferase involved in cell wall biosynthesis
LVKLALSILCENPARPTGLGTLFPELVGRSLRLFPEVTWLVYAGPAQPWTVADPRVTVVRDFPANDRLAARLWADHLRVGPHAAAHGAGALITTGFTPLRAPLPVAMQVVTLHHLDPAHGGGRLRNAYRRRALESGLRRAAVVIANSAATADRLVRECGAERGRLVVSPEGLDHERFHAGPADDALPPAWGLRPGYVLWLSNFYAYKRAELLLAAFARLPAELRARHPLVFAGGDWGGGLDRARAAAAALGVAGDVRFLGRVDDEWLPALYRGAALHALPSAEETFGRTVAEAMACGCPCVVNDLSVLREVAGGAAELADFADTAAAATALRRVLTDATHAGELRARGLRRAEAFNFDTLVRERIGAILERCR